MQPIGNAEAPMQLAALVVSAAGSAGSLVTQSWSMEWFGVPVSAVLAAFAGAGFVLAWLPTMPIPRLLGSVLFSAFAAIYGGPLLMKQWPVLEGAHLLTTLAIAAGLQILMPWLMANRSLLFERLLFYLPGKGGSAGEEKGGEK